MIASAHTIRRLALPALACAVTAFGANCASALAATPGPGWTLEPAALPTTFSPSHDAACGKVASQCDSLVVTVRNAGSEPSAGTTRVGVSLPSELGLTAKNIESDETGALPMTCELERLTCTYTGAVSPGQALVVDVEVEAAAGLTGTGTATATVEGGGAPSVSADATLAVGEQSPPFELTDFSFQSLGVDGAPDRQAGDHPYAVTTSFRFSTVPSTEREEAHGGQLQDGQGNFEAVQDPREIAVDLPLGLLGDPLAAERCPLYDLVGSGAEVEASGSASECPKSSRVGTLGVVLGGGRSAGTESYAIFDLTPEAGYPAQFGFVKEDKPVIMYASVIRLGSGYGIRVSVPGIPRTLGSLKAISLTFFGNPSERDGGLTAPAAFFANPVDCEGGQSARIEADSWEEPNNWISAESPQPQLEGCGALRFQPKLSVTPLTTQADSPSGYSVNLEVPQATNQYPVLATPDLKDATVTLPAGVSVSPAAADGLQGCSDAQIELASTEPASCPAAAQIGSVKIVTPLLEQPLEGQIYLGTPQCSPCSEADAREGHIFRLFLQAEGSGVRVKIPGTVSANTTNGQLTATFDENPQLPFSDLLLTFTGGETAPLANPQSCGTATTTSELSPWSEPLTPDATPSSSFSVTGCSGGFAPSLSAGTVTTAAGAYSPFTLTFSRADGQQDLSAIQVHTPAGLLGMLSHVPLCGEPQAAQGSCSAASQIGATTVAAGSGTHPYWLSGPVYLTGPYRGAPFGLSIAVPAIAGPFNLGTVVVRASIAVDPSTAALTITSDPLPQIVDGVPIRLQTVNVDVDRPEFMFNPTSCAGQAVSATIASAQGAAATVSSPFAATGCKQLPFKPSFTAFTEGHATFNKNGASLDVKVGSGSGQANVKRVDVQLPEELPARLTTLQKACPEAEFAASPTDCPSTSLIGTATAVTPLLNEPLTGSAYFVSYGGAAFPDVILVLQGQGVTIDLVGNTQIKNGITYSRFETVPDAPISSFELSLPEQPYSALAAPGAKNASLCGKTLKMPTTIEGQNGAVVTQTTKVAVTGCKPALYVRGHKASGKTLKLTVTVPSAGTIKASGEGLGTRSKKPAGEKLVTFDLKLDKARASKVSKKHRFKTKVRLVFTPKEGKKLTKTVAVTFK